MPSIASEFVRFAVVIVTAFALQSSVSSPSAAADAGALPGFEPALPPTPLPDFGFTDGAGGAITLADFRGKLVLLNIWATWCAPCVREMPSLDRLAARLGGPGFEVVALSQDRGGAPAVERFFNRLGIRSLKPYLDRTMRANVALGVIGLPTTILIDTKGREIGRVIGPAEWDSAAAIALIRHHLGVSPTPAASAE